MTPVPEGGGAEPCSLGQRLIRMLERSLAQPGGLNVAFATRVEGPLDEAALARAVDAVVLRHGALRSTVEGRGPRLCQRVHERGPRLQTIDTNEREVAELVRSLTTNVIDAGVEACRVYLLRVDAMTAVFAMSIHHLFCDGWSAGVICRDLSRAYADLVKGRPADLPPVEATLIDFAREQVELATRNDSASHQYWQAQIGRSERLRLPPPQTTTSGGSSIPLDLAGRSAAVDRIAAVIGVTPYAVLLGALAHAVHDLTGQRQVSIGSVYANRSRRAFRETVGFLANLVLLTIEVSVDDIGATIRSAHRDALRALKYQDVPVHAVAVPRGHHPTARAEDLVLNLVSGPPHRLEIPDATCAQVRFEGGETNRFGSELILSADAAGIYTGMFRFDTAFIDADAAAAIVHGVTEVLDRIAETPAPL